MPGATVSVHSCSYSLHLMQHVPQTLTWSVTSDLQELTSLVGQRRVVCSVHIWPVDSFLVLSALAQGLSQGIFWRGEVFQQLLQCVSLMAKVQDSPQGELGNQRPWGQGAKIME